MKKIVSILVISLFVSVSYAQSGEMNQEELKKIKASTTYVVLDDQESDYNTAMKANIAKFWKLTPVEYITYAQLNEYVKKPNTSFLMKLIFDYNSGGSSGSWAYNFNPRTQKFERGFSAGAPGLSYRYDGLVLVLGDRKKADFSFKDWMAYSLINDITQPENYYFKIGSYIQVIQNFIHTFEKSGEKKFGSSEEKKYYHVHVTELKDKVLYVRKADMPKKITDIAQLKEVYKYEIKFATDAEIEKAIQTQDEKVAILHHTETGNRYYPYISETKTGQVIYTATDRNYAVNPAKSVKKLLAEVCQ